MTGRIARITRFGILYSLCSYTPARAYAGLYTLRAFRDVPRTTRISYKNFAVSLSALTSVASFDVRYARVYDPFEEGKQKKKEHKTAAYAFLTGVMCQQYIE